MEAYKALVVLVSFVAVAQADSSTTNDGQEASCIDQASGRVYRLWESWAPADGGCTRFTCMVDGAVSECSCGRLQAPPGCTLVYPKGSHPECCPRIWCPSGVERFSILLSGKEGQSNDPSEFSGARQDLQHGSSGLMEDHTSLSSGATSFPEDGHERRQLFHGPQQVPLTSQDQDTRETLQGKEQSRDTHNFQSPIYENSGSQSDQSTQYPANQQHGSSEQTARTRDDLGRTPHSDHHASDHESSQDQPLIRQRHSAQPQNYDFVSPAQDWRQQESPFTSYQRTEEGGPGSIATTQTQPFLSGPNKESSNSPLDTIFRQPPQSSAGLLQPIDMRSMLSQFNPGMDRSKPQSPLAVFGNVFKLMPGLPGSSEEMLKQILPPGVSPLLPISQDNLIRLIIPNYTPEKPVTILELLNKIISRVPDRISEFLTVPRKLFQSPNLSAPNLFQLPSDLLNQQRGSRQETSNPTDLLRRLLPFNPLSSDTMSSPTSNSPLDALALPVQKSPEVLLSNFGYNAPQGSNFASIDFQDKFPSGSQPGFTSFTSIIPSDPLNNQQLLRVVGDINRRPFDTQSSSSNSNPQLQTNTAGGLFG